MRIKIINPNTDRIMTDAIAASARQYSRPDTQIVAVSPKSGPVAIDNYYDEATASIGVLEEIKRGLVEKFDGFVIACFTDPALQASRELSYVPVVGIGEASMLIACTIAHKFSILSMPKSSSASMQELVFRNGLQSRCASIRLIDVPVSELGHKPAETKELLLHEAREAIVDGAEAILLGCAGLTGFDKVFEKELGLPTIDGVVAAVKFLEGLYDYGLHTSKALTYRTPKSFEYNHTPLTEASHD